MNSHDPLPYVVKLRVVTSEDAPPDLVEWRGYAYDVMEAALQAMLEQGAKAFGDQDRIKVDSVAPDLPEYVAYITRTEIEKQLAAATPRRRSVRCG